MIWGLKDSGSDSFSKIAQSGAKTVLGFNEPEYDKGPNPISGDQAMSAWTQIYNTGLRTGSPAPGDTKPVKGDWFFDFINNTTARNIRPHFLCLHHYSPNLDDVDAAVKGLQDYLTGVYDFYVGQYDGDLKVWVTEYGLVKYNADMSFETPSVEMQAEFATKASKMLEGLEWVERYAWFAVPPSTVHPPTNLIDADGGLTVVGEAYRAV